MSAVSSSSASSTDEASFFGGALPPLTSPKEEKSKEKNWIKIGAIVATVIGALIAALAVLCIMKIFPTTLLGGSIGTAVTLVAGAVIAIPAAYVAYKHWDKK